VSADLHALSGCYAADALTPDEATLFETHLRECAVCVEEVRELRETAALLALAVAAPPPAAVKARVLGQVDAVRQLPPETGGDSAMTSALPASLEQRRSLGRGKHSAPGRRFRPLLVAAASVLVFALGAAAVGTVDLQRRLDRVEARADAVTRVLTAPDARTVTAALPGGGSGTVVVSARRAEAVFVGAGWPRVGTDRTYQLWLIGAEGPKSAGLFRPDRDGRTTTVLSGDPAGADVVGVTLEPGGGSARPTSEPLLALRLA
jgi:Anti-sigma-K factor rskA